MKQQTAFFACLLLGLLYASNPAAQPEKMTAADLDATQIQMGSHTFIMNLRGMPVGEASYTTERQDGKLRLSEYTNIAPYDVEATSIMEMDQQLRPLRFRSFGTMFGSEVDIDVSWQGSRISGYSHFPRAEDQPQGRIEIHRDIPGAMERSSVFFLAQALPIDRHRHFSFDWYNTYDDRIYPIEAVVTGQETITVPAGTFDTYRVELNGGNPSQVLHITTTSPRRVIRMEVVEQPWVYERVADNSTNDSMIYLVRHAEKTTAKEDPALTTAGQERARQLARLLHDAGITHIYSTDTQRTRLTAKPLADRLNLDIIPYDAKNMLDLINGIKTKQRILVVGHSNTTPALVRMLGGDPGTPITEDEYDRVYTIHRNEKKQVTVSQLRYGQSNTREE